jgi:hypothetical protein
MQILVFMQGLSTMLLYIYIESYLFIYLFVCVYVHVKCVPCHHGMARPQVADEEDGPGTWRAAENILNKQSRTAKKG